jgi:hypothetical protein
VNYCSGHGRCIAENVCSCDEDWTGSTCSSKNKILSVLGTSKYGSTGTGLTSFIGAPLGVENSGVLFGKNLTAGVAGKDRFVLIGSQRAYSWGPAGMLGTDNYVASKTPIAVKATGNSNLFGRNIVKVFGKSTSTIVMDDQGLLYCFGSNDYGEDFIF